MSRYGKQKLYINGRFQDSTGDDTFDAITRPCEVIEQLPRRDEADVSCGESPHKAIKSGRDDRHEPAAYSAPRVDLLRERNDTGRDRNRRYAKLSETRGGMSGVDVLATQECPGRLKASKSRCAIFFRHTLCEPMGW